MKIETYTFTWNEQDRIPLYLDHYGFADKHFVFDSNSDDNTREIVLNNKKCTLSVNNENKLDNEGQLAIKERCWENSDADWVIVGDVDEFLYHPNLIELLSTTSAVVLQPSFAYNMVCDSFIGNLKKINRGVLLACADPLKFETIEPANIHNFWCYCGNLSSPELLKPEMKWLKCLLFRPSEISTMRWAIGKHWCQPLGKNGKNIKIERVLDLILLHYHYLGIEWVLDRNKKYLSRLSDVYIRYGMGSEYAIDRKYLENYIESGIPIDIIK
jgi:glycosyltransferase involved in cell wall biosynthesis